ncbi:uncharacterized protein LOC111457724 isoform X1 [Cucurbita moschata]|uniref:Uncharacterized protein LOC111457724 isoform X1 n=1 Tax=Cucurbita moschata TaxID=3662 RepID=A0A6J1GV78_CUCMO|nr:uncharacterized protein LOC111457724 isoform X1 [Cucurbita moschata]
MPLLAEIFTAQPAFHCFHSCFLVNNSMVSLTFGNEKELSSCWKSLIVPKRMNFSAQLEVSRRGLLIRAIATLESKRVVHDGNGGVYMEKRTEFKNSQLGSALFTSDTQLASSGEDSEELDERERVRRERISQANKGQTPWNKGRKHSAETLRRIKERTWLAMQDPKVKNKLAKAGGHAQSEETRMKIGVGVRMGWQRRREKLVLQEKCYIEWKHLIAEASRRGYKGEEELQWDSYQILNERFKKEWLESVEQRKRKSRPVGSKRAPKSAEQRKKISESISAKWDDPEYRDRVCSAIAKYHGTPIGVNRRRPRRKHSESMEITRTSQKKEKSNVYSSFADGSGIENRQPRIRKSKAPRFKDPSASFKLDMIKSIRAQRAIAEAKKMEAIEQARLMIAEAEKAAKALEVAAKRSPIARASLLETRKLIAEALQSIECIDIEQMASQQTEEQNAVASSIHEMGTPNDEEDSLAGKEDQRRAAQTMAKGTQLLPRGIEDVAFDFGKFSVQDLEVAASTNGYGASYPPRLSSLANQPNGKGNKASDEHKDWLNGTNLHQLEEKADTQVSAARKKWVRGRLVEVAEVCQDSMFNEATPSD